jgi:hypothetical protein
MVLLKYYGQDQQFFKQINNNNNNPLGLATEAIPVIAHSVEGTIDVRSI